MLWGKVAGPNATFNLIFLVLGWPWVGEFVGFIVISRCVFQPNRIWYIANTLLVMVLETVMETVAIPTG